jgi:hypothetical protein
VRKRSDDPAAQAALDRLIADLGDLAAAIDGLRNRSSDPDHPSIARADVALIAATEAATLVVLSTHPAQALERAAAALTEARREFEVARVAVLVD